MRRRFLQIPSKLNAPLVGQRPPMTFKYAVWSFLSAVTGIAAIYLVAKLAGRSLLIAPLGASAVLLFGAVDSPLAQPRNLIGGHVISATIAVIVVALMGSNPFSISIAVGFAILAMNLTHTTHPPGGATALLGVQLKMGPLFILVPVLSGVLILLSVALVTNNFAYHRRYPKHWL
jgi:CBS-domain-containing membrane protein